MDNDRLIERLLDQNDRLIDALTRGPVDLLKALNPPAAPLPTSQDPWQADDGPVHMPLDPWGDENVPFVLPGQGGWTEPPAEAARRSAEAAQSPAEPRNPQEMTDGPSAATE